MQNSRGGCIDELLAVQAGDPSRVQHGSSLAIVPCGRNGNSRHAQRMSSRGLRLCFHVAQHQGTQLLGLRMARLTTTCDAHHRLVALVPRLLVLALRGYIAGDEVLHHL
mmetsp:Transcript_67093/g.185821  ORF Transcript_67093/g.185821 Transcript_67093/m.185821 type:complete len:109 (-) Transcript_67093:233-559(-)